MQLLHWGIFDDRGVKNSMDYKECYGCRKMIPKSNKGCYCPECRSSITESKKQYSVKAETEKIYKSEQWKRTKEQSLKRSVRCASIWASLNVPMQYTILSKLQMETIQLTLTLTILFVFVINITERLKDLTKMN